MIEIGSIDFMPDWAKKGAGVTVGKTRPERDSSDRGVHPERKGGKGFAASRRNFPSKPFVRGAQNRFDARPAPIDAEVKVLPEPKALGTIINKLRQDFHAYKLKDLAYFLLDNPASVLLKVTIKDGTRFHQCKACGFAAENEDELVEHILAAHLGDYYESREIECEAPKGNFNCVAKCGLSGTLLGPPNMHDFNETVKETARTRYPELSEAEYRSHIEMVRDPETIEAWRQSALKRRVFVAKGAGEGAEEMTRAQAEGVFRRTILPSLKDEPKKLMISADAAAKSPSRSLQKLCRDALEAERRAPYGMCFALHGAFHHRKLNLFRVNDSRGPEFVTSVEYRPFDAEHAIAELSRIANFIAANPCQPKAVIAPDAETQKHLNWLASTGHVVAFTNGVFSPVEKFPKYGPQWQKPIAAPAVEPAPESAVESAPEPAPVSGAVEESIVAEEKKDETAPVVVE